MKHRKLTSLTTFHERAKAQKLKKIESFKSKIIVNSNFKLQLHTTRQLIYYPEIKDSLCGIAKYCDWYINANSLFNITKTKEPKKIFIQTDSYKSHVNFIDNVLPYINNKFILIVGGHDYTWPLGKFDKKNHHFSHPSFQSRKDIILNHPNIIKIFCENLDLEHEKIIPIPLGMCFASHDEYYHKLLNDLETIDYDKKDIDVGCCHNIHPSFNDNSNGWHYKMWDDRLEFNKKCKEEPLNKIITFKDGNNLVNKQHALPEFQDFVKRSQFFICIHGGGIDPCPKVWESILLGSIPIIKHSTLDKAFEHLPVVFVDEFDKDNITEKKLDEWWDKLSPFYHDKHKRKQTLYKLSSDYWNDFIDSHL